MKKKAQKPKSMNSKRAQEEIVGFSMIIVLVAIIMLVFLSFTLKPSQKSTVESYEVESFLQALLQKTSDCRSLDNLRYYTITELMFKCYDNEKCLDNRETCSVLEKELGIVSNSSWKIGTDSAIKGYFLNISANGEQLTFLGYGNATRNSKGSSQELTRTGNTYFLDFKAYY